jgi:hypothetical protein
MLQGVLAIAEPIGEPLPPHGHHFYEQKAVGKIKYNHQWSIGYQVAMPLTLSPSRWEQGGKWEQGSKSLLDPT